MGGTKRKAESSSDGSSDVASLKAQLKALERENAQLKQQGKAKPKAAAAAASQFLPGGAKEGAAAGAPQQKKSKKAKLGDTGSGEAGQKRVPKPAAKAVGDAPSSGEPEEGAGRAKKAEAAEGRGPAAARDGRRGAEEAAGGGGGEAAGRRVGLEALLAASHYRARSGPVCECAGMLPRICMS